MNNKNFFTVIIFLGILIFLGYLFYNVLIFILLAIVFASVGSPLMQLLQKIKIKNKTCSASLAAGITLFVLVALVALGFYILIPIVIKEIESVSSIDPTLYTQALENWFAQADALLNRYGFLKENEHVIDILLLQMKTFIGTISISSLAGNLFSFVGALFILVFSVIFLSFFALKDKDIFFKMVRRAIPVSFRENYDRILVQSRAQIVRYFGGVFVDNIIIGVTIGLACYFANVPNALLIGVLAGIFNIIPYIGPFLAMGLGLAISITTLLPTEPAAEVFTMLFWKMTIIFAVIKAIDTFALTPVIFGRSMKVHPVEIFIVILLAGYVGGVAGMIFAVPAYSMIRIIVKEFFGGYYFGDERVE
ncbi:MAG: AI-2E family transporter [Lentimicrobiaceae bacterium]|nr:AI-2E family transporter [Lentimicrobiaceae bacterium]